MTSLSAAPATRATDPLPFAPGTRSAPANGTTPPFFPVADRVAPRPPRPAPAANPPAAPRPDDVFGMVGSVVDGIGRLVRGMLAQAQLFGRPAQHAVDVDLASTGDPHLSERGTIAAGGAARRIDRSRDSMDPQDDLLHAAGIDGGYRVSTTVTAPGPRGETFNASATVHGAYDRDAVTMQADGTIAVVDGGRARSLERGERATLSGGETVELRADGSLTVAASDAAGGSIVTTLRANGPGVDVTAHAHDLTIGGAIPLSP